jgi:hypothetical protein
MEPNLRKGCGSRWILRLYLVPLLLQLPPLSVYGWARAMGQIPSEASWTKGGATHGPWSYANGFPALIIDLSFIIQVVMLLFSLLGVPVWALVDRRLSTLLVGLGFLVLQVVLFFTTTDLYFWTVD